MVVARPQVKINSKGVGALNILEAKCRECDTDYLWLPLTPMVCPNGHDNTPRFVTESTQNEEGRDRTLFEWAQPAGDADDLVPAGTGSVSER